ncbi:MAG: hypothetical protein IJ139_08880 [Bacteroidaceae bacterium]|nr:hypothetical protein [Bacteroidaceae bacterium]
MYTLPTLKYFWLQLTEYVTYYATDFFNMFRDYPAEVKIAACIVIGSVVIMVVIMVAMMVKSHREQCERRLVQRLQYRFSSAINTVMYSDINPNLSLVEMKDLIHRLDPTHKTEFLNRKSERCMLCKIIYSRYITDTPPSNRLHNIHVMLEVFNIPAFLENQVSLGCMSKKVCALSMMRAFRLYINPWVINKLLNSKSIRVRRLAMYSSIMASSDSDLDYFETDFFDDHSCIYDEIELGYSLHRRQAAGLQLPNLAHWAHWQKRHNTRCMFVRLMRRFNQREYCSQLVDLFSESRHKKLIEEISRTWGYLHYTAGEKLLADSFLLQPDDTKVAITHALTRMATGKSLQVLVDGYRNTGNPHVRFESLRCLYNYGKEGRATFERIEQTAPQSDRKFFDFFHNSITLYRIPLDKEQAYHPSVETVHMI